MKVRDIVSLTYDKVMVYRREDDEFINLYKGNPKEVPNYILDKEVTCIGNTRGFIDLKVD